MKKFTLTFRLGKSCMPTNVTAPIKTYNLYHIREYANKSHKLVSLYNALYFFLNKRFGKEK